MAVTLLQDAGAFRAGATFHTLDWAISANSDVWPNGSKWEWNGYGPAHTVTIVAGIPVRDDGAVLRTTQSRYEWREWCSD